MKINAPCIITSRLLPGLRIDDAEISITYCERTMGELSGRTRYQYYIDIGNKSHGGYNLKSGCQGGNLQQGLSSLLCFLATAAEAYWYEHRASHKVKSENSDLFPKWVNEWAYQHSDEICMLQLELDEATQAVIEE